MRICGSLSVPPEDRRECDADTRVREAVGYWDADAMLADPAEVVAEEAPDPLPSSSTTLKVSPRARGSVAASAKRSGAVLHVGHRDVRQRTDHQVEFAHLLPERSEVRVVPSPDEARAEHREVPAVLGRRLAARPAPARTWRSSSRHARRGPGRARAARSRRACPSIGSSRRPRSCSPAPPACSRSAPSPEQPLRCRPPWPRTGRPLLR